MILSFHSSYYWTQHAKAKMAYYKLSENRIRRVIKSPLRVEEGIAPDTIAYMQPVSYKTKNGQKTWSQELWVMVAMNNKQQTTNDQRQKKEKTDLLPIGIRPPAVKAKLRVISAWRYPGMTKPQAALPKAILEEIREALDSY
jgi:hypothetical protein